MKTKLITADNLENLQTQAHASLGSGDIYIVNQKEIKVKKGLFRKIKKIEAIAITLEDEDIKHIKEEAIEEYKRLFPNTSTNDDSQLKKLIENEMKEIKSNIHGINLKMDNFDSKKEYTHAILNIEQILKKQDTCEATISKILRYITMNLSKEEQADAEKVHRYTKDYMSQIFSKPKSITDKQPNKRKIVMFVGTTGVGKTTTSSKLATILHNSKKKVGFITLDTYRLGAIDQLEKLCSYSDIPVKVASSRNELDKTLKEYEDFDYVFLDTTGRSQHNLTELNQIQDIIGTSFDFIDETYLVMSATTKYEDMNDIYSNFKWLNVNRIIFSKLDETNKYGNILSFLDNNQNLNTSYITSGQTVPTDIELINANEITESMLNMQSTPTII